MSFGKMNTPIEIVSAEPVKDAEGFVSTGDTVVANVRAYFEPKNATERWLTLAQSSEADALFRFRVLPGVTVTNRHFILCGGRRYDVYSTENVRNRGIYLEVLAVSVDG